MRQTILLAIVLVPAAFAACGGDDEPTFTAGTSCVSGAQIPSADVGMTAKQFIAEPIPDQIKAVQDLADEDPDCCTVDAEPGSDFQVGVAINAAQAPPSTPLVEIVADQCDRG